MKLNYFIYGLCSLALVYTACVKDEIFNGPATISNVSNNPAAPKSSDSAVITAVVTDLKNIEYVRLKYKTLESGSFIDLSMTAGPSHLYSAIIPAQPFGTKVQYFIEVRNSGGFITRYPADATQYASYTVGASNLVKLFINEVLSDGTKDATDPDWVEIYNDSDIPVDIGGYAFYDDGIKTSGGTKPKRIIKAGTIIPSKGFHVQKTEYTGGEYAVEFGLSSTGDAVYLENTAGILLASLDFLTINLVGKKSYGRKPDGSGTLVIFTTPTKGASNN